MKRITTFFLALFACLMVSAQSTLPDFSTAEDPTWYTVQFKTGSNYLTDGAGSKMLTIATATADNQMFQFIGTQSSFKMKSKAGYWVKLSSSTFYTTATESEATTLCIQSGSADSYWEISATSDKANAMNQHQGAGVGKEIHAYTKGDGGNQLYFNATEIKYPTFSTADDEGTYYFIAFSNMNEYWGISTNGEDNCVRCYAADPVDTQLWKLVGTKDKFQIVSKSGKYVNVSSESIAAGTAANQSGSNAANHKNLRVGDSEDANGFSLGEVGTAFEIISLGISGTEKYCNHWGPKGNSNSIGFWKTGDTNNTIKFISPEAMTYDDYKSTGIKNYVPEHDLTLWYTEPATTAKLYSGGQGYSNWMEYSLPIGDGQFGASLFGGIAKDEIQFNEKSLWTGSSTDLTSGGSGYGIYQNFGSVYAENIGDNFDYSSAGGATDYYRQLDLTTATGKTSFKDKNGVTFTREYIASNPNRVVAAHYTADATEKINLRFTMKSGSFSAETSYADAEGTFSGKLNTVSYNARFKVINTGGTLTTTSEGIEVKDADEVILLLAGATDFDNSYDTYISNTANLASTVQARINDAAKLSWDELYKTHVDDFQSYMSRVDFQLDGTKNVVPTDSLVDQYNSGKGAQALMLERLYFAYGRYLEISSSRGIDLPSNLQGIWNNMSNPAWNADIHSNINVQMNYWPAEPTNLSEMHLPFLNYIKKMAVDRPQWKSYAKTVGQSRGWTCWTENNIFGGGTKFASTYVIANAWYATHLWQHYRYTLDKEYLKEVFPAILSATQFWMDRLEKATDGTYEAPNEWSPEQGPTEDGVAHAQQIVRELFNNTLSAIEVLGDDANITAADLAKLQSRSDSLDNGLHSETYNGDWGTSAIASGTTILREWKYSSYTSGSNGHRHMSHLMCMYPFSQVYPNTEQFNWAVNSMKLRGDGATGWSMGWKINLWARALDGDHARTILTNALHHSAGGAGVCYNLFDMHAPFQIDGNFGACAGIAEMIMQSNTDTIRILPALPTAWAKGSMKGLKTVKDFTVDTEWEDGIATKITITNNQGQTIPVYYKYLKDATVTVNGAAQTLDVKDGVAVLTGEAGTVYTFEIDPTKVGIQNAKSATTDKLAISVSGKTVNVLGEDLKQVRVYDLQGRVVKTTSKTSFTLGKGNNFVIEAIDAQGNHISRKVVVE